MNDELYEMILDEWKRIYADTSIQPTLADRIRLTEMYLQFCCEVKEKNDAEAMARVRSLDELLGR